MASTGVSGELPRLRAEQVPRRPVSLTANEASTMSPLPQRQHSSTTTDEDTSTRMPQGEEAGGFRGRVSSTNSLPSMAGAGGLLRTWSYGGHASLDRAGASMPTELFGTPIARAGFLPDLEPLIMGSRSGVYLGRSRSTPEMPSPSASLRRGAPVNDPRVAGGAPGGDGRGPARDPRLLSTTMTTMDEPLLPLEAETRRGACCPALQHGSVGARPSTDPNPDPDPNH